MAINGLGAACTAVTLVVVLVSKFAEGAWVTVLLIPVAAVDVRRSSRPLSDGRPRGAPPTRRSMPPAWSRPIALLPIRGWSAITRKALRMAMKISPEVYALHIAGDEQAVLDLEDTWAQRVRGRRRRPASPRPG